MTRCNGPGTDHGLMLSVSVTQQQTHYHSRKHGFYEYFKYEMEHYVKNKIILASECLKEDSWIMPAPHGPQPVSKLCWNIFACMMNT